MGKTRYGSIDALDAAIEKIVDSTVRYFYTDWKNYDRPLYMCMKGSKDSKDRKLVLLARECGTYLLRHSKVIIDGTVESQLYNYYTHQEPSKIYNISLDELSIERVA